MSTTISDVSNREVFKRDARVTSLVGVAHGVSHFYHLILAPLFPWIKEAFHLSFTELGLLMTVFFIVSGIGQALSGFVVDRVGALKVLCFGLSCLALSSLVLFLAPNYATLLCGSMLAGLGNSVFHPSDYTLLNRKVSPARIGYAYSVHGITGNLGWFAAPVFLTSIAAFASWRVALLAASGVPLVVLITLLVMRKDLHVEPAVTHSKIIDVHGKPEHMLAFMKLPQVWMCYAFFLITAMALGGIQSFSSTSLRQVYGISMEMATSSYAAYMLASAGGMLLGGFIAARGRQPDKTIGMAFAGAGVVSILLASALPPASIVLVLMGVIGFAAGVAAPSRDLLIRGAAPKNATGRVYGVVYSGVDCGLALAPPLFGALMDQQHPAWLFLCIGVLQFVAIGTAMTVGASTAKRTQAAVPA